MTTRTSIVARALVLPAFLLAGAASAASLLSAQSSVVAAEASDLYRISGTVVDEISRDSLPAALVLLKWMTSLGARGSDVPAEFLTPGARRALADHRGRFEFAGLPNGTYLVIATRMGYMADTSEVTLSFTNFEGNIALEREPRRMGTVNVVDKPPDPFVLPDSRVADSLGVRAAPASSGRWPLIAADTRQVTNRDITEAITLAEPDVFRSLQRTPGVGTRDDYTASLWTRGAPWDQTRVYFDGMPLYNPTHAGWLFSSINPEGIGSAVYMPGVRPSWIGEGAAGVLDMRSRTGGDGHAFRASADLSVVSARISADGVMPGGSGGWMLALRRTYVDVFTSALQTLGGAKPRIPYDFSDLIGRVDLDLPSSARLEVSGIYERDHLRGDFPGILRDNEASWGNRAARITVIKPLGRVEASVSAGMTRFGTRLLEVDGGSEAIGDPTLPSLSNALVHTVGSFELRNRFTPSTAVRWALGAQITRQRASYDGPFSLTAEGVPGIDRDKVVRIPFLYNSSLETRAAWAQSQLSPARWLTLDVGARVEGGAPIVRESRTRFAPRISARVTLDSATGTRVGAGWARGYQYAQDVGAAAGPLGPQLHLTHIWQLASPGVPALRADIATIGIERELSRGLFFAANAYERRSSGVTIPDPTPGEIRSDRPLFAIAQNRATGVELSLRKLIGEWSGSVSYALADSRMRSLDLEFPSPADVRESFDATLARRLGHSWRISGAFSYASGVPYTQLVIGETSLSLADPYARRTPAYASADLSVDYTWTLGSRTFAAYMQVRNVFNRRNEVTYSGSPERCEGARDPEGTCLGSVRVIDRFDAGIPVLPLFGVRFVF